MTNYSEARKLATMLAAIGEPTRMLIFHQLAEGERNVGELATLLNIPNVNMSHHLGVMKQAGLVDDRKVGRKVMYRIKPELYTSAGESSEYVGVLQLQKYTLRVVKSEPKRKQKAAG